MKGAPGAICFERADVQGLLNDPFPREGGVAVDKDRHGELAFGVLNTILFASDSPKGDGVDVLKVTGVEAQGKVDFFPLSGGPVAAVAQVVLDVSSTNEEVGVFVEELLKNVFGAFAHDVGHHVESTSVSHGDHEFLDTVIPGPFNGLMQEGDEALTTFKGEAFGAAKLFLNELFKDDCVG